MARIRTIKPEFWTSEQITECSIETRLLFIGLLNFVDDGGRMPYSPKRIKGQIYPHDDFTSADIQRMIDELSSNALGEPLVVLYDVDGKRYLQITGWAKHQKIDRPTYQFPDRNGVIPEGKGFTGKNGLDEHSTSARHRKGMEGKGMERNGVEGKGKEGGSLTRAQRARAGPPDFEDDWPADYRRQFADAYPHKVGMTAALEALDNARGKVTWRVVMETLKTYVETKPPDRQWANPKTWITEERWNDRPAKPSGNGHAAKPSVGGDRARRLARQMEALEREGADRRPSDAIGGDELGGDDARLVSGQERE
jgi:hypothetical protein